MCKIIVENFGIRWDEKGKPHKFNQKKFYRGIVRLKKNKKP